MNQKFVKYYDLMCKRQKKELRQKEHEFRNVKGIVLKKVRKKNEKV